MAIKQRTTADQKLALLLQIFHARREFYSICEIEKIAEKTKGIPRMLVKDLIKRLLDDNLIAAEKIGCRRLFWSFLPQKGAAEILDRDKKIELLRLTREKCDRLRKILSNELLDRECSDMRCVLIDKWLELKDARSKMERKLQIYEECDPDVYKQKKEEVLTTKKNIDKQIDNIFCFESYAVDKFNLDQKTFKENFGIPDDLDYCT